METIIKRQKEVNLRKGGSEMKTMIQNKTAVRPQPKEVLESESAVREKAVVTPQPQNTPQEVASEITPNQGLCVTCVEAPNCTYAKQANAPVLFCEMFDDSEPQNQAEVVKQEATDPPTEEVASEITLQGLCVNCDNRHTCTFPKPETGVWHCEEYR